MNGCGSETGLSTVAYAVISGQLNEKQNPLENHLGLPLGNHLDKQTSVSFTAHSDIGARNDTPQPHVPLGRSDITSRSTTVYRNRRIDVYMYR